MDKLDPAIIKAFKDGEKVVNVEGVDKSSSWASIARIDVQCADGSSNAYFLKILNTVDASERVLGEYMSMLEIYNTVPDFAPRPRGYGKCDGDDSYFFLCDYLSIKSELPNPVELGRKLAEMHKKSQSPTGQFGFHVTTFDGKLPLNTTWDRNWTSFFKKLLHGVYELDVKANGVWKELDDLMEIAIEKLIPRLLDALVTGKRSIKPCLIHGDLWESNIGTDDHTGDLYIYDACAYYAHNEKEIAIWRVEHHEMTNPAYLKEYLKNFEPSEPKEEFDDRSRLYAIETLLINSAHFPGKGTRQLAAEELKYLLKRYIT